MGNVIPDRINDACCEQIQYITLLPNTVILVEALQRKAECLGYMSASG